MKNAVQMQIDAPVLPAQSAPSAQQPALAMSYVPMQALKNAYAPEEELYAGTLFPELDKPFQGGEGGAARG